MNKLIVIAIALTSLLAIQSCKSEEVKQEKSVRPVKSMTIGVTGEAMVKGFPGVTQGARESVMSFRVGGPIVKMNVIEGELVSKGGLIAEIDPRDYNVTVQSTKARYDQTKAESERYFRLWKKGSIAKNDYELKLANYHEAEAAWDDAKNAVIDTKLFAPYSGFYGPKIVELGEEVRPKEPIASVVDLSIIEVVTTVPEQLAVQAKHFEKYEVIIETYPDLVFTATLKQLEKKATAEGYPLHLYLSHKNNPNDVSKARVAAGMSCRVNIYLGAETGSTDKIIVPLAAVFDDGVSDNKVVWVIDTGSKTVKKQLVEIGNLVGTGAIEIVEGLSAGQEIVVAGVHRLTEGAEIQILESH